MVTISVLRTFRDLQEHVTWKPGDTFETTEARAEQIDSALPGYITYEDAGTDDDYDSMRVTELRSIAKERGIKVPRNANKETIAELLRG